MFATLKRLLARADKQEAEQRDDLLEVASDGNVVFDDQGTVVRVNARAERMFGRRRQDVIGQAFSTLIPDEVVRTRFAEHLPVFRATGRHPLVGDSREMLISENLIVDIAFTQYSDKGKPLVAMFYRDVTDRRHTADRLHQREQQLELLLSSTAEGIYGIDMRGNCTFANRACVRLLGYDKESELLGLNMHDCCHYSQEDLVPSPVEDCAIYRAFRQGVEVHRDVEVFWRKNHTCFPVEYWSYPVYAKTSVIGAVVTFLCWRRSVRVPFPRGDQRHAANSGWRHWRAIAGGSLIDKPPRSPAQGFASPSLPSARAGMGALSRQPCGLAALGLDKTPNPAPRP